MKKLFFVSKYPEISFTVVPADIIVSDNGKERPQKPVRIAFIKQVKPQRFQGDGMLGSKNLSGTDRNDNPYWGVFAVEDPGENPSSDIGKKSREAIDFLRAHAWYRATVQDNLAEASAKLKELDWDPRALESGIGSAVVARGREKVENPLAVAPQEGRADKPAARVADMSGRK